MKQQVFITIILGCGFLILFAFAELLYHIFKVKVEITRKIVHFGTGIITLLFPVLLTNHWYVLILCASFAIILVLSLKYSLLKSINAIKRKSYGSISYPISVYICYYFFISYKTKDITFGNGYILFYLPILILAISDPIAALFGKRWPYGKYKTGNETKTLLGSTIFLLTAFIISFCMLMLMCNTTNHLIKTLITSLALATITTVTEGLCTKGTDNLFIPLTTLMTLYLSFSLFW